MGVSGALAMLAAALALACSSCDGPRNAEVAASNAGAQPGASAVEPGSPELAAAGGQTIYVPAYSSVATADNARLLYPLAITLSVRNTDRTLPIVVTTVRYHHQDGRLVRDLLKTPLRIAPMASLEFFIREGDSTGGTVPSFLVDWVGVPDVRAPIVESVMVGTGGTQGISFLCTGRVIANRGP
jgi:hypothetical protein